MYFHKFCRFYNDVNAFVCTNQAMVENLERAGFDKEKLHFIPTPVDVKAFTPSSKRQKYILFSGKINWEKGIETLINAFAKISKGQYKLLIAGNNKSSYAKTIVDGIKKKGILKVEFTGYKKYVEIKRLNENAAFAVVPSVWLENAPNSITEALAAGTPVIASKVPGIMGMFDDGVEGFYFEPGNVDDLAEKMRRLIESEEQRKIMEKNARKLAETKYSPEKHYQKLIQIYHALINNKQKNILLNDQKD